MSTNNIIKGSGGCFKGNVQIATPEGTTSIKDIQVGDLVISFDDIGTLHEAKVLKVHKHQNNKVNRYHFWGQKYIDATPNHWVLNQFNSFVPIGTLGSDDCLVDENEHLRPILKVEELGEYEVFNLTVENQHTFIANGIRVHNAGLGSGVIRGAGGGGKGGGGSRAAQEDPDSLHSSQYAQVVEAISEGEIVGLVDGHKSIYLDETPLMASDGTYNFNHLLTRSVFGTQDQDYLPGFGSVEGVTAVSLEIKKGVGAPPPKYIYQGDLDAIAVTLSCNQLTTQNKENGDIHGGEVAYKIEIEYDANSTWIEKINTSFKGKTTKKYARSHRIELDKTLYNTQVGIKVTRLTDQPTDSSINDTIFWDSYTKIIDNKLSYPHTALVGMQIGARQFTSIPKRAYHIRGIKCKVPTNYRGYNPDTLAVGDELYEGHWDGTFNKVSWTSNPAWIYYDIITNPRYGLGNYIQGTQIDKWALYQIARYCDAVDDEGNFVGVKTGYKDANGDDTYEPRFACNVYIQDQQEALKVIQDLAFSFRGLSYWSNGQLVPVQDRPKEPVQLFSAANVIDGVFTYSGTAIKARKTVALVSWNDPQDFYRRKTEYVEDRAGIQRYGIRKTEITSFGCTSRGQAHRIGTWSLFTDTLETETLSFKTGLEASTLRPGDLIKVSDPSRAGVRYGGRIRNNSTKIDIILDQELTTEIDSNYILNVAHTDSACMYPQETAPNVAHPHAGEIYTPPSIEGVSEDKDLCISDGGQWSKYLVTENYPVNIVSTSTSVISIAPEYSTATAGTGAESTPFSIFDTSINFSEKFLNRKVTNTVTGIVATITNIISTQEVHVDITNFASSGTSLKYAHSLTNVPNSNYMWLLERTGQIDAQVWRVLGVKETKKNEYEIAALEYHEDKYRVVEEDLDFEELDERNISNLSGILDACPPPSDIDIYEESYISSDGVIKNKAIITWKEPDDYSYVRGYFVEYRYNKGIWISLGTTAETSIDILDANAGNYEVKIRSESLFKNTNSTTVRWSQTLLGLSKPPSSITQYCDGFPYARTISACENQGKCSTLDGSTIINSETTCTSTSPIDPNTGSSITSESRCTDLGHTWSSGACKGKWTSDGYTWTTDPTKFIVTNDSSSGTSLSWDAVPDLDIFEYELQKGTVWDAATNTLLQKDKSNNYAIEGGYYLNSGTHTFLVKAIDTSGVYSTYTSQVQTTITNPNAVTDLEYSFSGPNILIEWDAPTTTSTYAVDKYSLRYGSSWSTSGSTEIHSDITSKEIVGSWAGIRKYWVVSKDKKGNIGTPQSININIIAPNWSAGSFSHTLKDPGDVEITWNIPDIGSLPISNYEIRYGGISGDSATLIGTSKSTIFNTKVTWGPSLGESSRTFWIRATDSAGNNSNWQSHIVEIRNPIPLKSLFYNLVGPDQVTEWTSQVAGDSDYDTNSTYLLPVLYWEIKKGLVYGSATIVSPTKYSPKFIEKVTWIGTQRYWVTPIDSAGNKGNSESLDILINLPNMPPNVNYVISGTDASISWNTPTKDSKHQLDITEYELRKGATWDTTLSGSGNSALTKALTLDYNTNVNWRPYDPANNIDDINFFVRAIDSAGNYSEKPVTTVHLEGTGWKLAKIKALDAVQDLSFSFVGIMALITWKAPTKAGDSANNYLNVEHYEIRDNLGVVLKTTKSTSYSILVDWGVSNPKTLTIVAKDTAGNYGTINNIVLNVPIPDSPTAFNTTVIDNNVLMRWNDCNNSDKLTIDHYEVKRCQDNVASSCSVSSEAEWDSLLDISSTDGLFMSYMETKGNTYKYFIRSVDSAGNYSDPTYKTTIVNEPPDYLLLGDRVSTLDDSSAEAMKSYPTEITTIQTTNIFKGLNTTLLPVNDSESWKQHFIGTGSEASPQFSSPSSQIAAGYPYFLNPSRSTADLWQKWDLEAELNASAIQIILTSRLIQGSVSDSTTIYFMDSSYASTYTSESITSEVNWTKIVGTDTGWLTGDTFRYIKVHTAFTTDGGNNDLLALDEYRMQINLKGITESDIASLDSSSGLCNVTNDENGSPFYYTEGGITSQPDNNQTVCEAKGGYWFNKKDGMKVARVFFSKDFKDINYLNTSYKSELDGSILSSRKVIYDFEDTPDPSFFYYYILDTNNYGSITGPISSYTGIITWNARGVQ